jgi:hypothetical protein
MPRNLNQIYSSTAYVAALIVGVFYGVRSAYLGYYLARPVPFWDQIASAEEYFGYTQGAWVWLNGLFNLHNEHRIATSRVVFLLDSTLFDMTNRLSLFVVYTGLLIVGMLIITLALQIRKPFPILIGTLAASGIIWSVSQYENLSWGFQVQFPFVHLFALLTLIFLAFAFSRPTWIRWLILAIFADAMAIFSFSTGMLVGGAALALALWVRSLGRILFFFLLFHIGWIVVYLHGWPGRSAGAPSHIVDYLMFFVRFLGSLARPDLTLTVAFGAIITIIALIMICTLTMRAIIVGGVDAATSTLMAMACFCLLEAAATAVGRASFGPYQAIVPRYATPSVILVLCLLAVAWRCSASLFAQVTLAICLMLLTISANRTINIREWTDRIDKQDVAALSFINGVYTADQLAEVFPRDFPDKTLVERTYRKLAELRKGPFSLSATVYRPPLNSIPTDLSKLPACQSHIDAINEREGFIEIRGWIRQHGWVLAYARDARLVGFTLSSVRRNDVAIALSQADDRVGFDLFLSQKKLEDHPWPLQLVAVLDLDRVPCVIKVATPAGL